MQGASVGGGERARVLPARSSTYHCLLPVLPHTRLISITDKIYDMYSGKTFIVHHHNICLYNLELNGVTVVLSGLRLVLILPYRLVVPALCSSY